VSAVVNAKIDAGKSAINVNAAGSTSDVSLVLQSAASLQGGGDAILVNTQGKVTLNQDAAIKSTGGSAINVTNAGDVSFLLKAGVSGATNGVLVNAAGNVSINQDNLGPITATSQDGINVTSTGGTVGILENGTIQAGRNGVVASGSGNVSVTQNALATITAGQDGITAGSTGGTVTVLQNSTLSVGRDGIVVTGTAGTAMSTVTSNVAFVAPRNAILATGVTGPLTINTNASLVGQTGRGIDVTGTGAAGAATLNVNAGLSGALAAIRVNTVAASTINIATTGNVSATNDLAIETPTGPITVNNNGVVTGFVHLASGADTFNNNASGTWFTHSAGTAGSTSVFGAGNDVVFNRGRMVAARSGNIAETVVLSGLADFMNGDPTRTGPGLITMQDGNGNDKLIVTGRFDGVGNSTLAVDSFLGAPGSKSDLLVVGKATGGLTGILVNNTNPGPGSYNPVGIPVVDVSTGTTSAGDFFLVNGRIHRGMFFYDLLLRPDNVHVLAGVPDQEAFELPRIITATQEIWHTTTGVWLDRQSDLRDRLLGYGGSTRRFGYEENHAGDEEDERLLGYAAKAPKVSDLKEANPYSTPGFWTQAVGDASKRGETASFYLYNGQYGFDVGYQQRTYGLMGGVDGGRDNVFGRDDALLVGAMGGYISSQQQFNSPASGTVVNWAGGTTGAYVTYLRRAFFIDALVKGDLLKLDYDSSGLQAFGGSGLVNAMSLGGRIDTGVRFPVGSADFVELLSTGSYVSTSINDLAVSGVNVVFGRDPSLRARLGLRGTHGWFWPDGTRVTASLTTSVWQEFLASNDVKIVSAGPDLILTDKFKKTFGEVSGAVDFMDLGSGISAHVKSDVMASNRFIEGRVNIGARYQW
jgi:outer membrane autotransporter protein